MEPEAVEDHTGVEAPGLTLEVFAVQRANRRRNVRFEAGDLDTGGGQPRQEARVLASYGHHPRPRREEPVRREVIELVLSAQRARHVNAVEESKRGEGQRARIRRHQLGAEQKIAPGAVIEEA